MISELRWQVGLNYRRVKYVHTEFFTIYLWTLIWKLLIWSWISRYVRENCIYLTDQGFDTTEWVPELNIYTGENPWQIGWYEMKIGPITLCTQEHFEPGWWRFSIKRNDWIYM